MKWIKASERLPEESLPVYIRNNRVMMVAYHEPNAWFDFDSDMLYLADTDSERNFIEWLEGESTPDPQVVDALREWPTEEEFKAKFEELYNLPKAQYAEFTIVYAPVLKWLKSILSKIDNNGKDISV